MMQLSPLSRVGRFTWHIRNSVCATFPWDYVIMPTFRLPLALVLAGAQALLVVCAMLACLLWDGITRNRDRLDSVESHLRETAETMVRELDRGLSERWTNVVDLAFHLGASERLDITDPARDTLRLHLDRFQHRHSEFAWIGAVDPGGIIRAATSRGLEGANVADRPWFRAAISGEPAVGVIDATASDDPAESLSIAAPVRNADGKTIAVVGARLNRRWIAQLRDDFPGQDELDRRLEIRILNEDGTLLLDDARGLETPMETQAMARVVARASSPPGLAWTIVAQMPQQLPEAVLGRQLVRILLGGLVLSLVAAIAGILLSKYLTRPLQQLSRAASERRGSDLPQVKGYPEIVRLRDAFADLLARLRHERDGLAEKVEARSREVAESERRFRLMVENVRDYAIFMLDVDGRVTSWNAGAEAIKGWSEAEILGQSFNRFYPETALMNGQPQRELAAAAALGRVEDESWRLRRDGSRFWASVVITALRDDKGVLIGFCKITRDISERRRMEQTLRDSEERFRKLAETASDGIVTVDDAGMITYANAALETLSGYGPDGLNGRPLTLIMPESRRKAYHDGMTCYLTTGVRRRPWRNIELSLLHADGHEVPVEISFSEAVDEGRRCFAAIIRDVTERRRLQAQLLESQRLETIGTLAGGIAHELNNLLQPILIFVKLARDATTDNDMAECLDNALESARQARDIVLRVLAFARKTPEPATPIPLLREVAASATFAARLLPPGLRVHLEIDRDDGLALICRGEMSQVITNLFTNAAHAMADHGEITVTAGRVEIAPYSPESGLNPGSWFRIEIRDSGCGMDEAVRRQVFDPFFTTKPVGRGTGLGLSVVHGIVTGWQGDIKVTSRPGCGTSFIIHIPILPADTAIPLS
jgi:PAS domain S-box-containing protein